MAGRSPHPAIPIRVFRVFRGLIIMRTLSTAIQAMTEAEQQAWVEICDFYLKSPISTPFGTTDVIRICTLAGAKVDPVNYPDVDGISFFTPSSSPEPVATQEDAANYTYWPFKRKAVKSSSKFANDKLAIAVSNVTGEWAQMLADVDWEGVPLVIRKLAQLAAPTAADAVVLFSGLIDSARIDLQQIQFTCSSDLATLQFQLPNENMHANCRARFGDDLCTANLLSPVNSQPKTVISGSSSTRLLSSYAGYSAQAVTVDLPNTKFTLTAHTLLDGHRVRLSSTSFVPDGYVAGRWYYVVNAATDDFQLSLTYGGSVVSMIDAGSGTISIDSETGLGEDTGTAPFLLEPVTADDTTDKISLTAHGLADGNRVKFNATVMPGGLTANVWYHVVNVATDEFQVSETAGGSAIDLTSAGTAVLLTSSAPYGTDELDALSDGAITTSSEQSTYEGYQVKVSKGATAHWRFSDTPSNPTPSIDIYGPYVDIDFGSAVNLFQWKITPPDDPSASQRRVYGLFWSSNGTDWNSWLTHLETTRNGGFTGNISINQKSARYWRIVVTLFDGGALLYGVVGKVYAYATSAPTTDLVNPLSSGAFTPSNELTGYEAHKIRSGQSGYWQLNAPAADEFGQYDWGNNYYGYWQIRDAQAGLKNAALKPYIQFDLGSAKSLKLWRFKALDNVERQDIPKVILIFSSSDASAWTFESYFQLPPQAGGTFDCLIPNASSQRYWRVCVRSTWADLLNYKMFNKVMAYTLSRNYWASGRVTFASDTTTAALQGLTRPVLRSFSGLVEVVELPMAPVAGDRFLIQRGCNQSFNACAIHQNTENFAGFDTLPAETVVRG
jgi:hypothetical protein